jgi:hypothetical protein
MFATILGIALLVIALHDSFEVMVLPRRIARRIRLTRVYYRAAWIVWRNLCDMIPAGRHRENILSVFGPLSLFGLFATWVCVLISAYALIHWGQQTLPSPASEDFLLCLYHSGETFFTLGYGDLVPASHLGKFLAVVEAGMGFGFMAILIGYLPVLYQAFSKREERIALLDARAGSPPTAGELLHRAGRDDQEAEFERFLVDWEIWSADLLESHISFPILSFYRSQHNNQSWLAALATVLDVSATLLVGGHMECRRRAELTFAMARHACVDLCLVFWLPPIDPPQDRLTAQERERLLASSAATADPSDEAAARLDQLRELYEPFLQALSDYFRLRLPRFYADHPRPDNWQTSAWTKRAPGITELQANRAQGDEHFGQIG